MSWDDGDRGLAWGGKGSCREAISTNRPSHQQTGRSPRSPIPTWSLCFILVDVHHGRHLANTWHAGVCAVA